MIGQLLAVLVGVWALTLLWLLFRWVTYMVRDRDKPDMDYREDI